MLKIAHLILAHKNPEQVFRLVKSLQHPNATIFIHIDAKRDQRQFQFLEKVKNVHFIQKRFVVTWGGYSITECYISGMKEIMKYGYFDYCVLMSGQDYPLRPMQEFHDFLDSNRGFSFMSVEEMVGESKWWFYARERYNYYHLHEYNLPGKKILHKISKRIFPKRKFIFPDYKLYGGPGATFCALTREAALYIVNFMRTNTKAYKFAKLTHASDEFWFQTLLMNSPLRRNIINKSLFHICWKGATKHPKLFKTFDYPELLASRKFFARKFDIYEDEGILNMLDVHLAERRNLRTPLTE